MSEAIASTSEHKGKRNYSGRTRCEVLADHFNCTDIGSTDSRFRHVFCCKI